MPKIQYNKGVKNIQTEPLPDLQDEVEKLKEQLDEKQNIIEKKDRKLLKKKETIKRKNLKIEELESEKVSSFGMSQQSDETEEEISDQDLLDLYIKEQIELGISESQKKKPLEISTTTTQESLPIQFGKKFGTTLCLMGAPMLANFLMKSVVPPSQPVQTQQSRPSTTTRDANGNVWSTPA